MRPFLKGIGIAAGIGFLSILAVEPAHPQFGIDIAAILAGLKEVDSTLNVSIRGRPYFRARMQGDELEAWTTQQSRLSTVAAAPPRLPQLWRDLSRAD